MFASRLVRTLAIILDAGLGWRVVEVRADVCRLISFAVGDDCSDRLTDRWS